MQQTAKPRTFTRRHERVADRAAVTAQRLAGEAFDRQDAAVAEWIDEALAGAYTDEAQELARDVIRSAIAFYRDPDENLSDHRANIEALRERYIDGNEKLYFDEAWEIEIDADAAAAEAYAETMAEYRAEEAREAGVRG